MPLKFVDKEMQEDYDRRKRELAEEREYTPKEIEWLEFVVYIVEQRN